MKKIYPLALVTLVLIFTTPALAIDPIPAKPGFSGFVRVGGGILTYESNLVAGNFLMDVGQDTIDSLTDEPDSESTGMVLFNFELAWTFAETRTQLTLGSQLEDVARLDLGQQLAIKQELPDKSIIAVGLLFTSIPTEVWMDPYVTDTPREETDRSSTGARFTFDRILGTNLEFKYSFRKIDIDDEQSGIALGLSPAQRESLRRDGENHNLDLSYRFDFQRRHRLVPSISFYKQERDGDAMSNWGTDFQVTYFFFTAPVTLVLNGLIGMADYDEENPIYGKTEEDEHFAAGAQVYYKNPFGWKPFGKEDFSVFAAGTYLVENANIDFYDTRVSIIQTGVLLRF